MKGICASSWTFTKNPIVCYNIIIAVIQVRTANNKIKTTPELNVVVVSQSVEANRGPCKDLPRKLPRGFTENKREATHPSTRSEDDVSNTHSEYVMLIAFPLQQLLHERASMLRYKYTACLVNNEEVISSFCV